MMEGENQFPKVVYAQITTSLFTKTMEGNKYDFCQHLSCRDIVKKQSLIALVPRTCCRLTL
ncbi:hypothetical protein LEMLEM_LOCUS24538, partial [Lemmus lemmus]